MKTCADRLQNRANDAPSIVLFGLKDENLCRPNFLPKRYPPMSPPLVNINTIIITLSPLGICRISIINERKKHIYIIPKTVTETFLIVSSMPLLRA
jgi:hypothetical protein